MGINWLQYPFECDIVPSPIVDDQYNRLYRTDPSGDLKILIEGQTERDLGLEKPVGTITVTESKYFDTDSTGLNWYNGDLTVDCGNPSNSEWLEDGSVKLTYRLPESTSYDGCDNGPKLQFTTIGGNVPSTLSCTSNIILAPPLNYSNQGYSNQVNVIGVDGDYADYIPTGSFTYIRKNNAKIYESLSTSDTSIYIEYDSGIDYRLYENVSIKIDSEIINIGDLITEINSSHAIYTLPSTPSNSHSDDAPVLSSSEERKYGPCDIFVTVRFDIPTPKNQALFYSVTFIDNIGQESDPSDPSEMIIRNYNSMLHLTNIPQPTDSNITKIRIYRAVSLGTGGMWEKVKDIPVGTTEFYDFVADEELGIQLGPYGKPPTDIENLIVHPCGSLIGSKGRDIFASAPFLPYAWPVDYKWTVNDDIVALVIQGNDIVILTKGHPAILTGYAPEKFMREELQINQSCTSKRGVCKVGQFVMYPSPDGYVQIAGAQASVITEGLIDKQTWESWLPETMQAETYDKKLFVFSDSVAFQFYNGSLTTISDNISSYYRDTETDTLYIAKGNAVTQFEKDGNRRYMVWRSKEFHFERPVGFTCAQIIAEEYSKCSLNVYANGVIVYTTDITDEEAFRLSILRPERNWMFEVISNRPIIEFQIGTSIDELRN